MVGCMVDSAGEDAGVMRPRTHAGSRRGMPVRALLRLAFALALSGVGSTKYCKHGVSDNPDKNHCVNCAAKGKCSWTKGGSYCTDVCPPNYHLKQSEHSPAVHHAGVYCNQKGHWELNSDKSRAVCAADDCGPHTDKDGDSDLQGPAQMIHLLPPNAHWKNGTDWGCFAGQTNRPNTKGARCEAECDEGYYGSKGSGVFTCEPDQAPNGVKRNNLRQWTDDLQCTKDNTCPAEPPDAHASIKAGCDSRCSSDQPCTMTCDQGYRTGNFKTEQLLMCSCREGQPHWVVYGTETLQPCLGCQNPQGFPVQCTCDGPPVQGADSYRAYSSDRQNEYVQQDVRCNTTDGFQKLDPGAGPSSYRCDVGDSSSNGTWVLVNGTAELVCVLRENAQVTPSPEPTGPVIRPEEDWPWIVLGAVLLMLCSALAGLAVCSRHQRPRGLTDVPSVLRQSFLAYEKLPEAMLMAGDTDARWQAAASERAAEEASIASFASTSFGSTSSNGSGDLSGGGSGSGSVSSVRQGRRAKGRGDLQVMFRNGHVRELHPEAWQSQHIGQGTYGTVHRASWRGEDVAIKIIALPERTDTASKRAAEALRKQVEQITKDFVMEVEISCDLNHPNLVRLLGYADQPRLMLVYELLLGDSLDKQLYVEQWRPSAAQALQAAFDVASGMNYLHTHFMQEQNDHDQPIIHRDLKSGNLLLAHVPSSHGPASEVRVKVADFGLSRDKQLEEELQRTVQMTGCGSVLWMAPEILLGESYNESVDIFSYAMCLVELIDAHLPWHNCATGGQGIISHKVSKGERPEAQLRLRERAIAENPSESEKDTAEAAGWQALCTLVRECWQQDAQQRPSFYQIMQTINLAAGDHSLLTLQTATHTPVPLLSRHGSSGGGRSKARSQSSSHSAQLGPMPEEEQEIGGSE